MKKLLKQLFCKHNYQVLWDYYGSKSLYPYQPFYDAWQIKKCSKCNKEVPYE